MRGREERQREGVCVPEDVTAVARSGQPPGADGCFPIVSCRSHQVEQREPGCALEVVVTFDDDVGLFPTSGPGRPMLSEEGVEPVPGSVAGLADRLVR